MTIDTRTVSSRTDAGSLGRWLRFTVLVLITAVVLVPIGAIVLLALSPRAETGESGMTLDTLRWVLTQTEVVTWLGNSLTAALLSTAIAVVVAAPAGYVLSRGRSKAVSGYSLLLFVVQAFPVVVFVIPLFILFTDLGLGDSIAGLTVVYVAATMSVACWMMAAYMDSIPVSLEEAAWIDGCSLVGGFIRIVLRNSLPGILSTAIFSFLLSWNDYLVALVFLRSSDRYTLPIGLQTFFQQNSVDWGPVMALAVIMMLPPVLVFAAFNRYFSVGGIGGSLAGQ
ncbi:carbohydrate ABC transporter permease [Streptomyces phaeochromogenes]|uniref:Carbohydrate ABC transporter permease n=1 Tax=Streptomyces phaeochromogenes TaxID=1923 RepID=A0ABZ1HRA4_STRPH|nr:carbohydrate ABC transporter permease [Streptomyces phaeochromogenes]WSD19750.1 carbohydrate ABC transporter permease [Streptomyces phaeochromogenes]